MFKALFSCKGVVCQTPTKGTKYVVLHLMWDDGIGCRSTSILVPKDHPQVSSVKIRDRVRVSGRCEITGKLPYPINVAEKLTIDKKEE